MGRTPCCEKVGLKKGPWTPEEDQKLLAHIEQHGHGSWRALPGKAGLQRCGKSCRLRWTNYLRPDIKRGKFSLQEEQTIIQLHALLGNRWSAIATHLPKRTDNEIKNYWNTHLKKRLDKMGIDPVTHKPKNEALSSTNGPSKNAANLSHMAQWESARLEAEARLARQSKLLANSQIGSPTTVPVPDFTTAKQVAPCLDILKAWSGTWTKPPEHGNGSGGISGSLPSELFPGSGGSDLESPTSTLSFSDTMSSVPACTVSENSAAFIEFVGNSGSLTKEEGEEEWNNIENSSDLPMFNSSLCPMENPWVDESTNGENFMTKFTDLLLNNSTPVADSSRSFSDGNGEPERASGNDYYGDNKNYWNSILNLVNSSPSDSSVF